MMITKRCGAALVVVMFLLPAVIGLAQGFGEPSPTFGQSSTDRVFEAPGEQRSGAGTAQENYFQHDQLLKLLLVLGFSLAALGIIATRRFALRRWLLLASVIVLGFVVGGLLCPISAVQNVILKISTGYLLMFLVPTVAALFVGRLFCGYVCPFGALQELLHIRKWRFTIPARVMRILRWIPYAMLVYLVVRVLSTGILTWSGFTPFKAYFTFGGTSLTLGISGLFVLLSVFIFRPFCRLFCPLGAWLSWVSRLSPYRIRKSSRCVSCSRCDAVCASGAIAKGKVRQADCLLCGECISICPTDALSVCGKPKRDPNQQSGNSEV